MAPRRVLGPGRRAGAHAARRAQAQLAAGRAGAAAHGAPWPHQPRPPALVRTRRGSYTCDGECSYDPDARICLPTDLATDPVKLQKFLPQLYSYDVEAYGGCESASLPYKQRFRQLCSQTRELCGRGAPLPALLRCCSRCVRLAPPGAWGASLWRSWLPGERCSGRRRSI
jgi:hypothetical protein